MGTISGLRWALRHAVSRKLLEPWRSRDFSHRTNSFIHQTPDGLIFNLDPGQFIDHAIFTEGIYEKKFLELVKEYFLREGGSNALDIGANIGNHAIYLSRCFKRIHCFDPSPVAVSKLQDNIRLNKIRNVEIHAVGLSDQQAALPFLLNEHSLGSSGFVAHMDQETILLPVAIGDDYIDKLGISSVDFIKVDVENHEPEVFKGLRKTIEICRPIIAFEYHGENADAPSFETIAQTMPGYIYAEARHVSPTASSLEKLKWHMKHQGSPILECFTKPERRLYENILAFPDSLKFSRFIKKA